jgi:filamentous hemagglutinin family protein
VPLGGEAFFNNALNIENIFSRVTGGSVSTIDGLIRANGRANLFLINPNGIIFGENAFLNIGGSFLASTASSIRFIDGTEFSAIDGQAESLLTISTPIGLGFGTSPRSIINRSTVTDNTGSDLIGLRVQPDQTLALIGGDVLVDGGFLSTQGGRIELGSIASNNLVDISVANQGLVLNYEGVQSFRDINLSRGAFVSSFGDSSGDIQVLGRRITLTEGSQIALTSQTEGQAGSLSVRATELLRLEGTLADARLDFNSNSPTFIRNDVYGTATGIEGELTIETARLIIERGAQISAGTFGTGRGVDLNIEAGEVELGGVFIDPVDRSSSERLASGLFARVNREATGRGGTLTINTERLIVRDGAQISTETRGTGQAGNLIVRASDSIELTGTIPETNDPSAIFANVADEATATGNGGRLTIETERLSVRNGAQIGTTAQNTGRAGTLRINADSILLSGTSPLVEFRGDGRSGLFVSVEPALPGGQITTANGGDLSVEANELIVERGALISGDTFGTGRGADVFLNVSELILRSGGQIGAGSLIERNSVNPSNRERGRGGNIAIDASTVEITGTTRIREQLVHSELLTRAEGTGPAGNIRLRANSLILDNRGVISAETESTQGGNITLQINNLLLRRNSRISATAGIDQAGGSGGNGGNIDIDANFIIAIPEENSDITANAFEGSGGRVNITAQSILSLSISLCQ